MRKKTQPLKDQFALITGASRGIGLAIANALAEQSCNLILTARNEKSLGKVSKALRRYGVQVLAQPCDVGDRNSVKSLFRAIRREFPRLDILINNAGIEPQNPACREASVFHMERRARNQSRRHIPDHASCARHDENRCYDCE